MKIGVLWLIAGLRPSWSLMLIGPYISLYPTHDVLETMCKGWVMLVTCDLINVQWAINRDWPLTFYFFRENDRLPIAINFGSESNFLELSHLKWWIYSFQFHYWFLMNRVNVHRMIKCTLRRGLLLGLGISACFDVYTVYIDQ